jgi:GT2 family glycosyltransferase
MTAPLDKNQPHPLWSVMIPTYNCVATLRQTLESVLQQDPGPDQMQIEVVDNCSTADDPEALVRELGRGRVHFHRNPSNLGPTRNFNLCIERSRGELVHILHGDDFVAPTFHARLGALAGQHPECGLIASRVVIVDKMGHPTGISPPLPKLELGTHDSSPFYYATPLQYVGVVIRRSFYEKHGGFDTSFIFCPDREMWDRAVSLGGGIMISEPLASYRMYGQMNNTTMVRTAEHFRELDRLAKVFEERHPDFSWARHRQRIARDAWSQAERYRKSGVMDGYEANLHVWKSYGTPLQKARLVTKRFFQNLAGC